MSTEDDQRANAAALAHLESLGIHKPVHRDIVRHRVITAVTPPGHELTPREPKTHDLKVQTQFWADLWEFRTTAQLRQDDRQYRVGDILDLREYNPSFGFTGMKVGGRRVLIVPPKLDYPRWKPSWGYAGYVTVYVIDLVGMEPPPDRRVEYRNRPFGKQD